MEIRESEYFISQVIKWAKNRAYSNIAEDIALLKKELPRLAFKNLPPINKPLYELDIPNRDCKRIIWRVRIANSNNNKGKRSGYRIFYCQPDGDGVVLLIGVYPRPEIDDSQYRELSTKMVESIAEVDWI